MYPIFVMSVLSCDEIFSFTRDVAGYLRRVVRHKKHIRKLKLDDIRMLLNTYNLHSFLNKRKKRLVGCGPPWCPMKRKLLSCVF